MPPLGLARAAARHVVEGLDDVELGALAVGEEHVLVHLTPAHGRGSCGGVEFQSFGRRHAILPVGAAGLGNERVRAIDAGIAVDAERA